MFPYIQCQDWPRQQLQQSGWYRLYQIFSSWFHQQLLPSTSICEWTRQFDLNLKKNGIEINLEANITWMTLKTKGLNTFIYVEGKNTQEKHPNLKFYSKTEWPKCFFMLCFTLFSLPLSLTTKWFFFLYFKLKIKPFSKVIRVLVTKILSNVLFLRIFLCLFTNKLYPICTFKSSVSSAMIHIYLYPYRLSWKYHSWGFLVL